MFQFDDRNVLIGIFVIIALVTLYTSGFNLYETVLSLPGLIIALTLHEYAHARTAVKLGDPTPEMQGRLNLNPLSHLDPIGTICLLFGGFGWGKPVQINPANFRRPEKDGAKVAAAGPIMNFIIAIVCSIIYAVLNIVAIKSGSYTINNLGRAEYSTVWDTIFEIVIRAIYLNLGLGVFNLLPFPPLDGSKIFRAFLKGKAKEFLYSIERYSMLIIMFLFMTHIASYIISPIVSAIIKYVLDPIIRIILNIAL